MVQNNYSETAEYDFAIESCKVLDRLKNWHIWQLCMQSAGGTNYSGVAAFYRVSGGGKTLSYDTDDAELLEVALTIFIRSWGRKKFSKLKNYVTSSLSDAALARNAGTSTYLYKSEIDSLLHKVKYCLEYLEENR